MEHNPHDVNSPAMIVDMDDKEYHSSSAISSTQLKHFIGNTPRKAKYLMDNPPERTDAMAFGSVLHCLSLERDKFDSKYAVIPPGVRRDKRTEKYNDFLSTLGGREEVTQSDFDLASRMTSSLNSNRFFAAIKNSGRIEKAIFWTDKETGLRMRCKPDIVTDDGLLVDLKSAADANPYVWGARATKLGYDLSAALYMDGLYNVGLHVDTMMFVVVEKSAPYEVAVRMFNEAQMEVGMRKYRYALQILASCLDSGDFPGYGDLPEQIITPVYNDQWREGLPTYNNDESESST